MSASSQCQQIDCSFEESLINHFNVTIGANINNENMFRWNEQKEELTIVCNKKLTLNEFLTHYCFSASDQPNQQESYQNILSESLNILNEPIPQKLPQVTTTPSSPSNILPPSTSVSSLYSMLTLLPMVSTQSPSTDSTPTLKRAESSIKFNLNPSSKKSSNVRIPLFVPASAKSIIDDDPYGNLDPTLTLPLFATFESVAIFFNKFMNVLHEYAKNTSQQLCQDLGPLKKLHVFIICIANRILSEHPNGGEYEDFLLEIIKGADNRRVYAIK